MSDGETDHAPQYPFWPPGASEARVRECAKHGCEACADLRRRLDAARGDTAATDRGDASLQAFAGGAD